MPSLVSRHSLLLQTAYSEVKRQALEQRLVLVGTPGSVGERVVKERRFWYRQFYDAQGKKAAEYLGPVGDAAADARAEAAREAIASAGALAKDARVLAQQGYVRVDSRTAAIVAAFAKHGLFAAGAVLVGSHAYGVLLNELGVRASAFVTEDVDLARGKPLDVGASDPQTFASILEASTVPLHPVPPFERKQPSTSWKMPGAERLRVDLLVPARGRDVTVRAVPELGTHATALPWLGYVLEEPLDGVVLAREGAFAVRVPRPERLAWHKILVSTLRGATNEKRGKDLAQAAVLVAALAGEGDGALAEGRDALPRSVAGTTKKRAADVVRRLVDAGEERAARALEELL